MDTKHNLSDVDLKLLGYVRKWYLPNLKRVEANNSLIPVGDEWCPLCKDVLIEDIYNHCTGLDHIKFIFNQNPNRIWDNISVLTDGPKIDVLQKLIPVNKAPLYVNNPHLFIRLAARCSLANI